MTAHGLTSLGLALPQHAVDVRDLAALRGADPDKFTVGLGCDTFGVCGPDEDVVDLATRAAARALSRWGGDPSELGLLAVGTETAVDMSRPLSAWVADRLGLSGALRSYEVKHACYGGTLALRQALEWRASGAARGKHALVVAADVARYTPGGPAEPTQGAGAVAMVVGAPDVAEVDLDSHAHSRPAFDFWRPVGEPWPHVDGKLSLDCYLESAVETFVAAADHADQPLADWLAQHAALCFHVPFPKMAQKAWRAVAARAGFSPEHTAELWSSRSAASLAWNQASGNCYTAALWVHVACALQGMAQGTPLTAFSYGSGFGAELLTLRAGPLAAAAPWAAEVEEDLRTRTVIDMETYAAWRAGECASADASDTPHAA